MENEKGIDIFSLGVVEKVIKLLDPNDETRFSRLRLVKMNRTRSRECFEASRKHYELTKAITQEAIKSLTDPRQTWVSSLKKEDVVEILLVSAKSLFEMNVDLEPISGEKDMTEEQLEVAQKEKVEEFVAKHKKELEGEGVETLRGKMVDHLVEMEANQAGNKAFFEMAIAYSAFPVDGKEPIFSPDPKAINHVSNIQENIYGQLTAAYTQFCSIFRASPKELRKTASRGSDFTHLSS
jgi:hypothetical protein